MIDNRYAAGFFDGEGCIHIARSIRVILGGCFTPGLLEKFANQWGGKVTLVRGKGNRRPGVRWEITGGRAYCFLFDVLPYLFEKRLQASVAIEYHHYKRSLNVRGGKGYNREQKKHIEFLEEKSRELKKVVHDYL